MHKRTHHSNATRLLSGQVDGDLPYVALELRFTIEAIAYDKVRLYAGRLPADVLDKWQPPQVMKALAELEPMSTKQYEVRIAMENESGEQTGQVQQSVYFAPGSSRDHAAGMRASASWVVCGMK